MTKERYKQILEGELELLNKFQTEATFLHSPYTSNFLQLIELKLKIADRLCKLEESENS